MRKHLSSEKGTILIETAMVCFFIFLIVFVGLLEIFSITTTTLYVHKVVREGAREAAIIGATVDNPQHGVNIGKIKAESVANQYLKDERPLIQVYLTNNNTNVVCSASVDYRFMKYISKKGMGNKTLNAKAIYPWFDEAAI